MNFKDPTIVTAYNERISELLDRLEEKKYPAVTFKVSTLAAYIRQKEIDLDPCHFHINDLEEDIQSDPLHFDTDRLLRELYQLEMQVDALAEKLMEARMLRDAYLAMAVGETTI